MTLSIILYEKVKTIYENAEVKGMRFTIKWAGAIIAEVGDHLDFHWFYSRNYKMFFCSALIKSN